MLFLKFVKDSLCKKFLNSNRTYTKLSYKHQIGEYPLKFKSFGQIIEETVMKHSDTEVIISRHQSERLHYQKLLVKADQLAAGIYAIGGQYGDRVGLWAPNILEWQIVNIACARAGFILVALNPMYEAPEIEYCINKVGIKTIICPEKSERTDFYSILNKIMPRLEESEAGKLNCAKVPSLKNIITIADKHLKGTQNLNDILDIPDTKAIKTIQRNQHLIRPDDPLNIQFTSGTTGKPKAAILSHFNIVNNSFAIAIRNEFNQKQHKICLQVPFFHAFGYTISFAAAIHFGTTVVIPSPTYNPTENLKAIEEENCTVIHGTPTMYVDLLNTQKQKCLNINPEIAVSGGAPCAPELLKQMKDVLKVKKVKSVYGLTETTSVVFQSLPINEDMDKATNTVGYLCDHLEAKVVDNNNHIVPIGTPGELCIRGYTTMLGYWKDEEKTRETIEKNFWLRTGDQFILREDGYGQIVGRLKDMIIRGGENIYPKEIEDFLQTHPNVLESYVIGIPHERLGEEICACIRLRKGSDLSYESLVEFCTGNMAYFKIPKQLLIRDSFPKTQSGKIQKHLLKQEILNFIK